MRACRSCNNPWIARDAFRATANGETGARSRNLIHSSDCTRDNRIARTDAAKHHWNVNICVNDQTTSGASQMHPHPVPLCILRVHARAHLYVRRTRSAYKVIKSVHSEIYKSRNKECVRARKSATCGIEVVETETGEWMIWRMTLLWLWNYAWKAILFFNIVFFKTWHKTGCKNAVSSKLYFPLKM